MAGHSSAVHHAVAWMQDDCRSLAQAVQHFGKGGVAMTDLHRSCPCTPSVDHEDRPLVTFAEASADRHAQRLARLVYVDLHKHAELVSEPRRVCRWLLQLQDRAHALLLDAE